MGKKIILISVILLFIQALLVAVDLDIDKVEFDGLNIAASKYKDEAKELEQKFNIAYSPLLPADGVYVITDAQTGKQAVVQVGYAEVDKSPYALYLPESIFNFFLKGYEKPVDRIKLKVKFLAWNKEGEEANDLNLFNLVIKPENALAEISKNGLNNYYIQLGAFSYYQNSYPVIISLLPLLDVLPKFYMVKSGVENSNMFRVLAGPYSLDKAREIARNINLTKKGAVFIHSGENIIEGKNK